MITFMNFFELDLFSLRSSNFIKNSKLMLVFLIVMSFQMNLIKPFLIIFLEKPNFSNSWLVKFVQNHVMVFNFIFNFIEVFQNFLIGKYHLISHFYNINYMKKYVQAFKKHLEINIFLTIIRRRKFFRYISYLYYSNVKILS